MSAEILDACCGGRMWWWDKEHPLAVYMDKRDAPNGSIPGRPNWKCNPDLIADFRELPFADQTFQLVLFDPPHLVRDDPAATLRGITGTRYGVLERATEYEDLHRGFAECWRVLRPGGTLVFKWAGDLKRVEAHFPATPVVGTRSRKQTRWMVFYKPLNGAPSLSIAELAAQRLQQQSLFACVVDESAGVAEQAGA